MDKNPFLKRSMKEKSEDVMHSSAYAEAQNEGNIGAASTQSFTERQTIEANRTTVRGYRDSKVVNDVFGSASNKLQGYNKEHDASQRAVIRERFGGERNTGAMVGQSKVEGTGRTMPAGRTTPPPARRNPGISR